MPKAKVVVLKTFGKDCHMVIPVQINSSLKKKKKKNMIFIYMSNSIIKELLVEKGKVPSPSYYWETDLTYCRVQRLLSER